MKGGRDRMRDGVIDLKIENDVEAELRSPSTGKPLAQIPGATKTLEYLADHGGEVNWSWEGIANATREMVADLIQMELVKEIEYVTSATQLHGRLALRLTDKGRNVVATHRKRKVIASEVKPLS